MNSHGFPNSDPYQEHESAGSESFWPAFTDIMMVIVMVFLLVTVSVILNNLQLMQNLKRSIASEQLLVLKAQAVQQTLANKEHENESLGERLNRLEAHINSQTKKLNTTQHLLQYNKTELQQAQTKLQNKVAELQLAEKSLLTKNHSLMALHKQLAEQTTTLEQTKKQHLLLNQSLATQKATVASLNYNLQQKNHELEEQKKSMDSLQQSLSIASQHLKEKDASLQALSKHRQDAAILRSQLSEKITTNTQLATTIDQLKKESFESLNKKEQTIEALHLQLSEQSHKNNELVLAMNQLKETHQFNNNQLSALKENYDSLNRKYKKLIRPARSSVGKHITKVIYRKRRGVYHYQIQTSPNTKILTLSKQHLLNQLQTLKQKYGDSLYIKVVIPSNSGLSHNEAWAFTSKMLNTYDYYNQQKR